MNKYYGLIKDFTPVRTEGTRVVVSYGKVNIDKENAEWREVSLFKKQVPNVGLKEVKTAIVNDINERITEQIIGGMTFEEKPVWLSIENQINFSQATAPCRLKIGEEENGTPVYHDFNSKADLKAFVDACLAWKDSCLEAGRSEKENIDWAPYEALFPTPTTENQGNEQ